MVSFRLLLGISSLFGLAVECAMLRVHDCSFQWPAATGDTCQSMALDWEITEADFIRWNSGVNCDALVNGQYYCLYWDGTEPTLSSSSMRAMVTNPTSTAGIPTPTPTHTTPSAPSPTQDGTEDNCKLSTHYSVNQKTVLKLHIKAKNSTLSPPATRVRT